MSNTDIVNGWYKAVQFRNAPQDELSKFVAELNSGVPSVTVQNEILKTDYTIKIVNEIVREYQAAFVRVPDQTGESFWVNKLGSGAISLSGVTDAFANTTEFNQIYHANALTPVNAFLVDEFYNNVLQRQATSADVAYWTGSGFDAAQMLQALVLSPEMIAKATPYTVSYQFGEMAGTPQVSGSLIPASFDIAATFHGVKSSPDGNPQVPDNALAVGPSNIVTAENSSIHWTDLKGQSPTEMTFADFFKPITSASNDDLFDPVINYDASAGRYVVVVDQYTRGSGPADNHMLVAVSKDFDPNHGWYFQSVDTAYTVGRTSTWADYPMVSVDQNNIYISTNQFFKWDGQAEDGPFAASELTVINKYPLYSGGVSKVNAIELASGENAISNFVTADPLGGTFIINHKGDYISLAHDDGSNFTQFNSLYLGLVDTGSYKNASQPGTSLPLDAGDGRVVSATANNGHLYAVFEVQPISGPAAVHWVDLKVTDPSHPELVAQGNVFDYKAFPDATTFNGSIAVDKAGDVIINFNASSSNLKPTDYYIVHKATEASGVFSSPIAYQKGESSYEVPFGDKGYARWGDYSSAVADPNHAAGFWVSSEFATSRTSWGTSIAQVLGLEAIA